MVYTGSIRKYKPTKVSEECTYGTASDFKRYYTDNLKEEEGELYIQGTVIRTSPKAMAILKSLLNTGCCYIEERAKACREIFLKSCTTGEYVDENAIVSAFCASMDNPFVQVLHEAILEVVKDE